MRLKLLNGAPLCEHLTFSNDVLLEAAECHGFDLRPWHSQPTEEQATLKWREIESKPFPHRTGWSQPYLPGTGLQGAHEGYSFTIPGIGESSELLDHDTSNLDTTLMLEEVSAADDYVQHSLVFYDTLLSSQVVQDAAGADETVTSSSFLTSSFGTTESELSSPSPTDSRPLILQVPSTVMVTPLGSLPSAQHLRSIYPQTPTPNLLCALITTPERREVFVRKGGYKMVLWEITIGDDTCASFKVTFWLRPPCDSNNGQNHAQVHLLQILEHLQVGDIILLRNVALASFREVVYGQSLNIAITRARTSVNVLVNSNGMPVAQTRGLPASITEILTKVKRWARSHVAGYAENVRKRKSDSYRPGKAAKRSLASSVRDEDFPPDTMESP